MDAFEEIRNASHLVSLDSDKAMVDLFGDEGPAVKANLILEMGADDAGKFTIGFVVGAQLMQSRMQREAAG